jgi:hypothetical protein
MLFYAGQGVLIEPCNKVKKEQELSCSFFICAKTTKKSTSSYIEKLVREELFYIAQCLLLIVVQVVFHHVLQEHPSAELNAV